MRKGRVGGDGSLVVRPPDRHQPAEAVRWQALAYLQASDEEKQFTAEKADVAACIGATWLQSAPRSEGKDPWTVKDAVAHSAYFKADVSRSSLLKRDNSSLLLVLTSMVEKYRDQDRVLSPTDQGALSGLTG